METFSVLLAICAGISPFPGEFPAQRPVTRSFEVFFDLRLNKRLGEQWRDWWFETPSHPLWRHGNVFTTSTSTILIKHTRSHSCSKIHGTRHLKQTIASQLYIDCPINFQTLFTTKRYSGLPWYLTMHVALTSLIKLASNWLVDYERHRELYGPTIGYVLHFISFLNNITGTTDYDNSLAPGRRGSKFKVCFPNSF